MVFRKEVTMGPLLYGTKLLNIIRISWYHKPTFTGGGNHLVSASELTPPWLRTMAYRTSCVTRI